MDNKNTFYKKGCLRFFKYRNKNYNNKYYLFRNRKTGFVKILTWLEG